MGIIAGEEAQPSIRLKQEETPDSSLPGPPATVYAYTDSQADAGGNSRSSVMQADRGPLSERDTAGKAATLFQGIERLASLDEVDLEAAAVNGDWKVSPAHALFTRLVKAVNLNYQIHWPLFCKPVSCIILDHVKGTYLAFILFTKGCPFLSWVMLLACLCTLVYAH